MVRDVQRKIRIYRDFFTGLGDLNVLVHQISPDK